MARYHPKYSQQMNQSLQNEPQMAQNQSKLGSSNLGSQGTKMGYNESSSAQPSMVSQGRERFTDDQSLGREQDIDRHRARKIVETEEVPVQRRFHQTRMGTTNVEVPVTKYSIADQATQSQAVVSERSAVENLELPAKKVVQVPTIETVEVNETEVREVIEKKAVEVPSTKVVDVQTIEHVEVPTTKFIDVPVTKHVEVPTMKTVEVPVVKHVEVPVTKRVEVPSSKFIEVPAKEIVEVGGKGRGKRIVGTEDVEILPPGQKQSQHQSQMNDITRGVKNLGTKDSERLSSAQNKNIH